MSYYAKISDPKASRKALLEAAKEPIIILTQKKDIEDLRKKKHALVQNIQNDLDDLLNIIKKLDKILPEKELRKQIKHNKLEESKKESTKKKTTSEQKKVTKTKTKQKKEVKAPVPKPMTEVDRLTYTLSKIEEKLSQL